MANKKKPVAKKATPQEPITDGLPVQIEKAEPVTVKPLNRQNQHGNIETELMF